MIKDLYLEDVDLETESTIKDSKVMNIINERFYQFTKVFEDNLKQCNYKKIGDDLKNIYVIEGKYVVFVGLMYEWFPYIDPELYKSQTDDYFLSQKFKFVIDNMVYDEIDYFNIDSIINDFNKFYKAPNVYYYETNQYLIRKFEGESSIRFNNDDKFFSIAELFKDRVDIYELLEKNQLTQKIDNNYDIKEIAEYYNQVRLLIESQINDFTFKYIGINDYEGVYLIEDSLIFYIGVKGKYSLFKDKNADNGNIVDRYCIDIQELTYNSFYKSRDFSKFIKSIHILSGSCVGDENRNNINYRPFSIGNSQEKIVKGYHPRFYHNSNFDYVNDLLPDIKLKERYESWQGELRYFIVYEFIYFKDEIGYAVTSTLDDTPRLSAKSILRRYENNGGYLIYFPGITYDESWGRLIKKFVEEQKELQWSGYKKIGNQKSILAEKVQYYIVPLYVNNSNIHDNLTDVVLKKAKNKEYKSYERTLYDISEYRWKSEELMLECVKKVFKNKKVVHQYRPYFLGQQSYDVFVCGENIAFEYQGKQHFEPVEIFGGEEGLEENKKRDLKKAKLSKENGIRLIYINYWEDITVDLIKNKLEEK